MEKFETFVLWAVGIFAGLVILVGVIALISGLSNSASHRYWIKTGDLTYYTNAYEEKDGCVTFVNEFGSEMKQCGLYSITDTGN